MNQSPVRYQYVDALRGFAALWVLFYHLWNRFYPSVTTQSHVSDYAFDSLIGSLSFFLIVYGYSGVTLFFVLSGFCIHLPQAKRRILRVEKASFAKRRFGRLYPAYVASIVFSIIVLLAPKIMLQISQGKDFDWKDESKIVDGLINAVFLQQLWPSSLSLNGVYWTLLFEVQFYIFYPVLLAAMRCFGLIRVGLLLLLSEVFLCVLRVRSHAFFRQDISNGIWGCLPQN